MPDVTAFFVWTGYAVYTEGGVQRDGVFRHSDRAEFFGGLVAFAGY